jgi:hypothetical protein
VEGGVNVVQKAVAGVEGRAGGGGDERPAVVFLRDSAVDVVLQSYAVSFGCGGFEDQGERKRQMCG